MCLLVHVVEETRRGIVRVVVEGLFLFASTHVVVKCNIYFQVLGLFSQWAVVLFSGIGSLWFFRHLTLSITEVKSLNLLFFLFDVTLFFDVDLRVSELL